MPESSFLDHEKFIDKNINKNNLIFVYGDSYLMSLVKTYLLSKLIPDMADRDLYLETHHSDKILVGDLSESLFSFSFFSEKKILIYEEPKFFGKNTEKETETASIMGIIEREIPSSNYLIIFSSATDKRSRVYKLLKDKALVIDCSLPLGTAKKARRERENIARLLISREAEKFGVTVRPDAVSRLMEYSGDDLKLLMNNFEQVSIYASDKNLITVKSVEDVLNDSHEDPIYNFTGAVLERDLSKSFLIMNSLLDSGFHPLQLISALVSSVKKLILAHEFLKSSYSNGWSSNISYDSFSFIVNGVKEFDEELMDEIEFMEADFNGGDFLLHGVKGSTYPLFLLLKNASRFQEGKLKSFIIEASNLDHMIKNGGDPVKALERLISYLIL